MKRLYVLFDAECALCQRCRQWLARQPRWIDLKFVALQSPDLADRFPGIEKLAPADQLLVISDTGAVYRGSQAWIMCLHAWPEYRTWAQRLAAPALLPWARRFCELVSQNRLHLSRWLLGQSAGEIDRTLQARSRSVAHLETLCLKSRRRSSTGILPVGPAVVLPGVSLAQALSPGKMPDVPTAETDCATAELRVFRRPLRQRRRPEDK